MKVLYERQMNKLSVWAIQCRKRLRWVVTYDRHRPTKYELLKLFSKRIRSEGLEFFAKYLGAKTGKQGVRCFIIGKELHIVSQEREMQLSIPKTDDKWKDVFLLVYSMNLDCANRCRRNAKKPNSRRLR